MGPSKVLTTFPLQIQSYCQLSLLKLLPLPQHCDSLLEFLQHVYLHCAIWPPSANAALSPHPRLLTSYPPSAHYISSPPHYRPLLLAVLLRLLTLSGFFNGMLEVFEPGALNYSTFYSPILSTLSASRNAILTHLPLSGFLDSLLCVLIAPTTGLTFSLVIPRTLATALSFSSGRAYLFLNFLLSLFA